LTELTYFFQSFKKKFGQWPKKTRPDGNCCAARTSFAYLFNCSLSCAMLWLKSSALRV